MALPVVPFSFVSFSFGQAKENERAEEISLKRGYDMKNIINPKNDLLMVSCNILFEFTNVQTRKDSINY